MLWEVRTSWLRWKHGVGLPPLFFWVGIWETWVLAQVGPTLAIKALPHGLVSSPLSEGFGHHQMIAEVQPNVRSPGEMLSLEVEKSR